MLFADKYAAAKLLDICKEVLTTKYMCEVIKPEIKGLFKDHSSMLSEILEMALCNSINTKTEIDLHKSKYYLLMCLFPMLTIFFAESVDHWLSERELTKRAAQPQSAKVLFLFVMIKISHF
jgi:hypothetical protein